MKHKVIPFILVFIVYSVYLSAGKPHILNFAKESYLGGNKNWCAAQDERGTMYFANDIGLLEFDGIEWQMNYLPNSPIVRSVAVKSHQTIFTGSYEEFGRWDRDISGKLQYTSLSEQVDKSLFKNDDFWKIIVTDEGVYFQSFSSVYLYDYKTVTRIPLDKTILFLIQVREEFLVQEMLGSVYRLHGNELQLIPGSEIFSGTDVRVILPFGQQGYLFGSASKGLHVYENGTFREWNPELSRLINTKDLNCGLQSSRETYYLGTIIDGIYEIDINGNVLNHFSSANTLRNNTILSLYEDNLQNIWATLDQGISYIQYLPNMSCYTDPSGNTGSIYDVIRWNGRFFLATNQGVLYIDEEDMDNTNALSNARLIDGTQGQTWSLRLINNRLYCCHNKGIKEITPTLKATEPFVTGTGVFRISQGNINGREMLLMATYHSIKAYDPATNEIYHYDEIREPVINLLTDHLGNIWLEHANRGVYKCKPGEEPGKLAGYTYYGGNNDDGLPYKMTIFRVGGRIVLFGNDHFYTYDDIHDTIVDNIHLNQCFAGIKYIRNIIHTGRNEFYAITRNTIYPFTYDGYTATISGSFSLGINMSLVHNYENISIPDDSTRIICMDNGFLLHQPGMDKAVAARQLPLPHIGFLGTTDSQGNQLYFELNNNSEIPYNYNTPTFGFLAQDVFARNLAFQYKLSGVDKEWMTSNKLNTVSYPRLPDAKYTFAIRTVDQMGNYSHPVQYHFEIMPPWYRTVWAYLLYFFLVLSLFYLIWTLILRRYRNLHLKKIRIRETRRLRQLANDLQEKVKQKDAELFTQTSFIVQKNELIMKFKSVIDDYYKKHKNSASTAFYVKVNQLLNANMDVEEDWKLFLIKFEEKHSGFFRKMKIIYPELTSSDLRLCACLKLNMDTKEIASLMNLSIKAVENNRYRLRKKFNLKTTDNLNEFILSID